MQFDFSAEHKALRDVARVLGAPADIRADKDLPFDRIPTAASGKR